jgi:hypothetical protein
MTALQTATTQNQLEEDLLSRRQVEGLPAQLGIRLDLEIKDMTEIGRETGNGIGTEKENEIGTEIVRDVEGEIGTVMYTVSAVPFPR